MPDFREQTSVKSLQARSLDMEETSPKIQNFENPVRGRCHEHFWNMYNTNLVEIGWYITIKGDLMSKFSKAHELAIKTFTEMVSSGGVEETRVP